MTQQTILTAGCGILVLAVLAVSGSAAHAQAKTVKCSGPFTQSAAEIGAFCEIENGKMKIWYKDRPGTSSQFEACIGKVFEANGRPNPYRPAAATSTSKR